MTLSAFVQDNILLFALATVVLAAVITLEYRSWQTRGCDLSSSGLSQAVNTGATLIDLRSHEDYRAAHIAGAKNIPFDELDRHLESLGDKTSDIVFYCQTGSTSTKVLVKLRKENYTNIKYLKGGMALWHTDNLPVAKKA